MAEGKIQESNGMAFISQKIIREKGIKKLKIVSEPDYVKTEYDGKSTGERMTCTVETDVIDPKNATWQMNKATNNYLVNLWGRDTKLWMGKVIEVNVRQTGNMKPSVYPVDCSLEKTLT